MKISKFDFNINDLRTVSIKNKQNWHGLTDLIWRLFARNVRSAHRRSILGLLWLVIPPLVNTGVWVFLHSNGVIKYDGLGEVSYLAFALTGIMFWQTFVDALQNPFKLLEKFQEIIKNLSFNHFSLMGASMLEAIFNTGIRVVLLVFFFFVFGVAIHWQAILALFPLLTLLILGFALSMCLMPFYLMYRDIPRLLAFGIQFGFFVTPIVYQMPQEGWFAKYGYLNPVTPPILMARELLLQGYTDEWSRVLWVFILAVGLFFLGLKIFKITCRRMVERI